MRSKLIASALSVAVLAATGTGYAVAYTSEPGQSMTHMNTGAGL